jgi:hypothetical protein
MRHIYAFHGYPISEEMLLGLGAGVGFVYWHSKGSLPFLGGRANVGRPGEEGLEKAAGRRSGVQVDCFRTGSAARAEKTLLAQLEAGQPVMLMLDMGFLPFFDFGGEEFHFGGHAVAVCGYDPATRQALVADRDADLHPVSLEALRRARGSQFQPFPPRHAWYDFDFSRSHPPEIGEIFQAIRQCAGGMLAPPITNLGVAGIHKAARRIREWPRAFGERDLRMACFNTAILIDARGGTGGGLFRYMYARFLAEAAQLASLPELEDASRELRACGDGWEETARLFERACTAEQPGALLDAICASLPEIAAREERAWRRLWQAVEQADLEVVR